MSVHKPYQRFPFKIITSYLTSVIWQEYMTDKGLDFTPQLFFTGSNAYTDQMALLIDNNDTSCITLLECTNGKCSKKVDLYNNICAQKLEGLS